MVKDKIQRFRYAMEKLEIFIEDLIIIITAFIVLLIVLGIGNIVSEITQTAAQQYHALTLVVVGWSILPWILMLGIMIIARDFWIIRRILEKAVRIEAKLERELETGLSKKKKK
ncbi:MAG TPA: hypothetical protein EYH09_02185 [Candidatus Nanopusillus sp.]|nr:hypothetical protein [Candidatus Nanopusillus sp.]HIP90619.1 hypothetical protein [Candidatus Nanopusillus sp.]